MKSSLCNWLVYFTGYAPTSASCLIISQKIVFNQLFNSNAGFLKEEIEFLRQFSETVLSN
jgi:hypothetical protein